MKNLLYCCILLSILPLSEINAQKKHSVAFNTGNYAFMNVLGYQKLNFAQSGLQYEYNVHQKWNVFLGVSGTFKVWDIFSPSMVKRSAYAGYLAGVRPVNQHSIGKLIIHGRQTNFDAGVAYEVLKYRKHRLKTHIGLSFSRVFNEYLGQYSRVPGFDDLIFQTTIKKESYFGGLAGVQYDYALCKDRLQIGAYGRARAYNKSFPFQINYGLQLSYSF